MNVVVKPLSQYCNDEGTRILIEISENRLEDVKEIMEDLEILQTSINILLASTAATNYQQIRNNLITYETFLKTYRLQFEGKLQEILPAIRGNEGSSEDDLASLITEYSEFIPFKAEANFLVDRYREIETIEDTLEFANATYEENMEVVDYNSATDVDISLKYKYVIILTLNILQTSTNVESFVEGNSVDESLLWFNGAVSILRGLRETIVAFKLFASANQDNDNYFYLVKLDKLNDTLVEVSGITNGEETSFTVPGQPDTPTSTSQTHDSITISVTVPTNDAVTSVYAIYWSVAAGEGSVQNTSLYDPSTTTITIGNLNLFTQYQYCVIHSTMFGISPSSEASESTTLASSPPANLAISNVSSTGLEITSEAPIFIHDEFSIEGYKLSIEVFLFC